MVSTCPLLPLRLNHKCSNFQKSQTFQSVPHASTQSQFCSLISRGKTKPSKKPKPWINPYLRGSWKDLLQSSTSNAHSPDVWKVIRGLNGTSDTNSPNGTLSHNDCTITDTKSKANILINH